MKTIRINDFIVRELDWQINVNYIWEETIENMPTIQIWNRFIPDEQIEELKKINEWQMTFNTLL